MRNRRHTVAIVYGFAEGAWHSRKLKSVLRAAGFKPLRDVRTADIIIAHSAGCYLVPADAQARLILHSGYPYWPGRTLRSSLRENLQLERHQHGTAKWLVRCAINGIYMFKLVQTMRMLRGWHDPFLDKLTTTTRHVFVRNRHDNYCQPTQLLVRTRRNHTYLSLPEGNHNDLWDHPQYYIGLIQSLL